MKHLRLISAIVLVTLSLSYWVYYGVAHRKEIRASWIAYKAQVVRERIERERAADAYARICILIEVEYLRMQGASNVLSATNLPDGVQITISFKQ